MATARSKRKPAIAPTSPVLVFDDPPPAVRTMRICCQGEMDAAVNVITRAMLRGFVGLAIGDESLPMAFVASADVAAEMARRWNAVETGIRGNQ